MAEEKVRTFSVGRENLKSVDISTMPAAFPFRKLSRIIHSVCANIIFGRLVSITLEIKEGSNG